MENKTVFKVGDKVFDIDFGWGEVISLRNDNTYPIEVKFYKSASREHSYTYDGREWIDSLFKSLSFTEYTYEGFSQERPKEPLPFNVGDVVYLSTNNKKIWYTDELERIDTNAIESCYIGANVGRYPCLAIENPFLNPNTKIYTIDDI